MSNSAPYALAVDAGGDSFPVTGPTPRLSWKVTAVQEAYEVTADVDGVVLSDTVESGGHLYVNWPWAPLSSGQRVSWRVRTRTAGSWSDWSTAALFEAGLFDDDWTAAWISPVEAADAVDTHAAALLTGVFDAPLDVESARLYATALGLYSATLNGQRVGTTELAPGATSYDLTLHAQAYDVTGLLKSGQNRLEVVVTDGWYRGEVGAFRDPAAWGDELAFRAELHLRLADGGTQVIRTGGTWTSAPSRVTRASLMDGETVDFASQILSADSTEGEERVLVNQVLAPAVTWSPAPPVRVLEERAVERWTQVREGVWVADFGQNASGWVRLSDLGPGGTRTTLDYGEFVGADGDVDTSHLDSFGGESGPVSFVQRDEVVSSGDATEVFEPRHTVHGFQYVRVTRPGGSVDPVSLTMRVVATDLTPTGTFECNDADLNRLWAAARWSFLGNAVDIPTDCPTRERIGWTGDYQVFVSTAALMYDVLGFSRKWLQSVRDDQLDDGRIANFSPDGRHIKRNLTHRLAMMTGSAGWGDAIVHVPWELWRAYGDLEVLAESYEAMNRWVDWALDAARTNRHQSRVERSPEPMPHEAYIWDGTFHWGEWCEPKPRDADGNPIDTMKTTRTPGSWPTRARWALRTSTVRRQRSQRWRRCSDTPTKRSATQEWPSGCWTHGGRSFCSRLAVRRATRRLAMSGPWRSASFPRVCAPLRHSG